AGRGGAGPAAPRVSRSPCRRPGQPAAAMSARVRALSLLAGRARGKRACGPASQAEWPGSAATLEPGEMSVLRMAEPEPQRDRGLAPGGPVVEPPIAAPSTTPKR